MRRPLCLLALVLGLVLPAGTVSAQTRKAAEGPKRKATLSDYRKVKVQGFTLMINNVPMSLQFEGLSGAGLYQFNFVLPPGLGKGDMPVQAIVGGLSTQTNVVIALQ